MTTKESIETCGPLRILCLNYEYPPVGGGGGRVAHRINAGLVARGHSVRVHTAGMRHLPAHAIIDGVEIFRTASLRKKEDTCTVPEMALYLATNVLPTIGHIRKWKPDVIHAHFAVPTGVVAYKASLLTGVPYVLTAHLGDVPGGVPEQTAGLFRFVEPFTRPIWKRATAVTAVSTFVADLAEKAYRRKPEVIPNGIDLGPRPPTESHQPPRILMVGRLSLQKNPLLAIRALASTADIPWELHVIGDGPLRSDMKAEVARHGLQSRVRFLGWLDASEVRAEMLRADILLVTSTSEGQPMAAIEALDRGLAIIATRIGGMLDVVEDGNNGLLLAADPAAISEGLRGVLTSPDRLARMRKASSELAARFDIRRCVESYEAILTRSRRTTAGSRSSSRPL